MPAHGQRGVAKLVGVFLHILLANVPKEKERTNVFRAGFKSSIPDRATFPIAKYFLRNVSSPVLKQT
jgi:hypothetical protein